MAKWEKVGFCRLSKSERVLLIKIDSMDKWFIIDVEKLFDVLAGYLSELEILEGDS